MNTFLFILDKFSALLLEILMVIFSLIGILSTIYGLLNIPFYINKIIFQKVYALNIIVLSILLLITLIFILFRKIILINNKLNKICNCLCIILIILSLLGFIMNVIIDTFIINNMYFYDNKAIKNNTTKLNSKEWLDTIFVIILIFFVYFIFIFLALSDNLRINLKIDDSYYKYQLAIEEEMNKKNSEGKIYNNNNNLNEKNRNNEINICNSEMPGSGNELNKNLAKNEEKKK